MSSSLRRGRRMIALSVASALTVAVLLPVTSASAEGSYPDDGPALPVSISEGMPARDSQLGHGAALKAGIPESIDLGGGAELAHSALVRLSAFRVHAPTTLSVSGAPALFVATDRSASTTVLAPVRNGALMLTSSTDSDVRVDVLALFSGDRSAPGATVALDLAVSRPDATESLVALAAGQPLPLGVVGLGGVPVTGVRAVHVSLTVTAEQDATLSIDGQHLPVAAGTSTLSTIVRPSLSGDVDVTSDVPISARFDVRGYVTEAGDYPTALNGPGSYWPQPAERASRYAVDDEKSVPVPLTTNRDAAYAIALVWAAPADDLTLLELGEDYRGRARGGVVDDVAGAQPQLAVVPLATDPSLKLRRGATNAHVLELGTLLGDRQQGAGEVAIRVDSPEQGVLDLGDRLTFNFEGTIDTGDVAPLRIEVTRDGAAHGSASIVPGSPERRWSFATAVAESGHYDYEFTVVARDGSSSSQRWSGTVVVPGADDVILQADAVVMGGEGHDARVIGITDDVISFAADPNLLPGNVIVAGASDGAPAGFLRRVAAIDVVNGVWVVTTVPAVLTEVFLQADYSAAQGMAQEGDEYTVEPGDPDLGEITEIRTLPIDDLDLAALPEESEPVAADDEEIGSLAPVDRIVRSFGRGVGGMAPMALPVPGPLDPTSPGGGGSGGTGGGTGGGGGSGGGSIQGPTLGDSLKHTFKDEGSAAGVNYKFEVTGELAYALSLTFELGITFTWSDGSWWPPIPPLPVPALDKFSTILESTAKSTVTGKLEFKSQWKKEIKGPKFDKKFTPITFAIGPVPVVITTAVKIELKASVSVSAVVTATFQTSIQAVSRKGFRLGKDGKFAEVNEAKFTHKEPTMGKNSGLSGSASAQAGPEIALSAKLYDTAGPSVGASLMAGLGVEAKLGAFEPMVDLELYLSGNAFVKIAVTVPVIDYKLLEATLFEAKFKWKILEWHWKYSELFDTVPGKDPDPGDPGEPDPEEPDEPGEPGAPDALEFARRIKLTGAELIGAAWVEGPAHHSAVGILDDEFPGMSSGDKAVLSTGSANSVRTGNSQLDGEFDVKSDRGPDVFDVTTLRLDLRLPDARMCLSSLYFALVTHDHPNDAFDDDGEPYGAPRDFFLPQWDGNDWFQDGDRITAPHGISRFLDDESIGADESVIDTRAARSSRAGPYPYHSGPMATEFPVTPGDHSLYLTIADFGGSNRDTTVIIDEIQFIELWGDEQCTNETTWAH